MGPIMRIIQDIHGIFPIFPHRKSVTKTAGNLRRMFCEVGDAMVQLDGVPTVGPVSRGPRPKAKAKSFGREMVKQQMLETQRRGPQNSHGMMIFGASFIKMLQKYG